MDFQKNAISVRFYFTLSWVSISLSSQAFTTTEPKHPWSKELKSSIASSKGRLATTRLSNRWCIFRCRVLATKVELSRSHVENFRSRH